MSKYIPADRLRARIEKYLTFDNNIDTAFYIGRRDAERNILALIDSLQQEQPIGGKQTIIISETDGDANIHWDCRSLEDVMLLLESAKSYISDKQNEELRGQGSGPDYNTTEGRFRNAHKFKQEQPKSTCKTCGFYENNCPFIRGKLIPYPNKGCKDYIHSAMECRSSRIT